MFVTSLMCIDPACGATFDVYSATVVHGLTRCRFCGGSLMDVSPTVEATDSVGGGDVDEVVVTSAAAAEPVQRRWMTNSRKLRGLGWVAPPRRAAGFRPQPA